MKNKLKKPNKVAFIVNSLFLDSDYMGKDWEAVRIDLIKKLTDLLEDSTAYKAGLSTGKNREIAKQVYEGETTYEEIFDKGRKQERERLLSQKANQHDNEVRDVERERILEEIKNIKNQSDEVYYLEALVAGDTKLHKLLNDAISQTLKMVIKIVKIVKND